MDANVIPKGKAFGSFIYNIGRNRIHVNLIANSNELVGPGAMGISLKGN